MESGRQEDDVEKAADCFDLGDKNRKCGAESYIVKKERCNLFKKCGKDDLDKCPTSCNFFDEFEENDKYITVARVGKDAYYETPRTWRRATIAMVEHIEGLLLRWWNIYQVILR